MQRVILTALAFLALCASPFLPAHAGNAFSDWQSTPSFQSSTDQVNGFNQAYDLYLLKHPGPGTTVTSNTTYTAPVTNNSTYNGPVNAPVSSNAQNVNSVEALGVQDGSVRVYTTQGTQGPSSQNAGAQATVGGTNASSTSNQ